MQLLCCRVLVTGASGGFGAAIGRELRQEGADLLISARREDASRPLADELDATTVIADLRDSESVRRLAAEAAGVGALVAAPARRQGFGQVRREMAIARPSAG